MCSVQQRYVVSMCVLLMSTCEECALAVAGSWAHYPVLGAYLFPPDFGQVGVIIGWFVEVGLGCSLDIMAI